MSGEVSLGVSCIVASGLTIGTDSMLGSRRCYSRPFSSYISFFRGRPSSVGSSSYATSG